MKNLLIFAAVVVAIVLAVRHYGSNFLTSADAARAKGRVHSVLESNRSGDEQTAICMWGAGKPLLSSDEIRGFVDGYAAFFREKGIARLSSFAVGEPASAGSGRWRVPVTIDGSQHAMLVPDGAPLLWGD